MNPVKIIDKKDIPNNLSHPNQEQVWDSIAAPWKNYVVKKIPLVIDFLKDKKGRIIDFGCGAGRNMLPNPNLEYYGVDFSQNQLLYAKKLLDEENAKNSEKINFKLFKSNIESLDKNIFKDNMFDYGLFISTLHCLNTKQAQEQSLAEFYRILKPKAQALISVWNKQDKRFKNKGREIYILWKEDNIPYLRYYYFFDKKELIQIIQQVGFKILKIFEPINPSDRFSKKNLVLLIEKE